MGNERTAWSDLCTLGGDSEPERHPRKTGESDGDQDLGHLRAEKPSPRPMAEVPRAGPGTTAASRGTMLKVSCGGSDCLENPISTSTMDCDDRDGPEDECLRAQIGGDGQPDGALPAVAAVAPSRSRESSSMPPTRWPTPRAAKEQRGERSFCRRHACGRERARR